MKQTINLILFLAGIIFTVSIFAHPEALPKTWKGNIHFGYVSNSGNSRNTSGLAKLDLRYKPNEKWQIGTRVGGQFSSDKKGETARKSNVAGDAHYYFIPHQFGFTLLNYQYDKFSPYIYTALAVLGYGWDIFDTKSFHISLRAGPGIRHLEENTSKKVDSDIVGYTEGLFRWNISENVEFHQSVSYEYSNSNAYTQSKTALITKIIGNLILDAAFSLKHYSKIPKFS